MIEILLYALFFIILAIPTYFIDRRFGAPCYRWGWNMWHKEPLPIGMERGFIVGRTTGERFFPALVLTVISCFILFKLGERDVVMLFLKSFLMLSGFLCGFALTGLAMKKGKIGEKAEQVFAAVDRVENGEVNLTDVARDALGKAQQFGTKVVDGASEAIKTVAPADDSSVVEKRKAAPKRKSRARSKEPFKESLDAYRKRS